MNRRNFLKNGSLAGLSLTGLSLVSCNSTEETKPAGQKTRASQDSFELSEMTVDDLQKEMQDGPAAIAGCPSITVPMGSINELPIGLSFIGAAYNEPGIIAMVYAYEQASKSRSLPKFKNTYGS